MKIIKSIILFSAVMFGYFLTAGAQTKTPEQVKQLLESRNYIFKAEMMNPQGSISRPLTPEYDLTISRDTVVSFLPYFGRAYSAPINLTEGGIKFTSTKFDYNLKAKGKKWEATIRPKDTHDVQQIYLEVFDNGYAILQVISNNRQAISFNGYIEENKAKSKKGF